MNEPIPTIGRRIWFYPGNADRIVINQIDPEQPCDAGIVFVHPDGSVNLSVTDHYGSMHRREHVRIVPLDDLAETLDGYAQWMPYQVKAETGRKTNADRDVCNPYCDAALRVEAMRNAAQVHQNSHGTVLELAQQIYAFLKETPQ